MQYVDEVVRGLIEAGAVNLDPVRGREWLMRTYAGHTTARASNALYRENLARGQQGLSIAFDLPTQIGMNPDQAPAEVGKVGVSIVSLEDMRVLFDGIPLETMNTSMTINATAAWLLALYVAHAEERGIPKSKLDGTVQNDLIKEILSRKTHRYPPEPSLRLTGDIVVYTAEHMPGWNPMNVSSYHLQEAGATPVEEVAFTLCSAIAVLDRIRDRGVLAPENLARCVGRISFFCNSSLNFLLETAKFKAFTRLWKEIARDRYGVTDPKQQLFRYGVQVNSLGLTEQQPLNNAIRIVLEALGVTLSAEGRCRALQLPGYGEASRLPTPDEQELALRTQQILAWESDVLKPYVKGHPDIFEGSLAMEAMVAQITADVRTEMVQIESMGGIVPALDYVANRLTASLDRRIGRVLSGEQRVVGVNCFTDTVQPPISGSGLQVDESIARDQIAALEALKARRSAGEVAAALQGLVDAAQNGDNIMPASIRCAQALVTTGEWGGALAGVFGEYSAPTGTTTPVSFAAAGPQVAERLRALKDRVQRLPGRRIVIGKPGLDGHDGGAKAMVTALRDAGFEVIYAGVRLDPAAIVEVAVQEDAAAVGLSILSGSHYELTRQVLYGLNQAGNNCPVVVGGIIPPDDADRLKLLGVREVFTPKNGDPIANAEAIVAILEGQPAE